MLLLKYSFLAAIYSGKVGNRTQNNRTEEFPAAKDFKKIQHAYSKWIFSNHYFFHAPIFSGLEGIISAIFHQKPYNFLRP